MRGLWDAKGKAYHFFNYKDFSPTLYRAREILDTITIQKKFIIFVISPPFLQVLFPVTVVLRASSLLINFTDNSI